jgi:hypothetical protein
MRMINNFIRLLLNRAGLMFCILCMQQSSSNAADGRYIFLQCKDEKQNQERTHTSDWIIRVGNNYWAHFDAGTRSWGTNLCNATPDSTAECRMDDSEISLVVRYSRGAAAGDTRTFLINRYVGALSVKTIDTTGKLYTGADRTCHVVPEPQAVPRQF